MAGSALGAASLEGIANAIAGSPTENEARARVAPLFNREVAKLMATGMSYADAESHANEAISGHLQEEMSKSNLPEWAGTMLNVVGGIGGWSLGAKLVGKGLAKMGAKAVAGEAGAGAAKAASLADSAIEDPAKKIAAGAVGEGSGRAAEVAAKPAMGPFPGKPKFSAAQEGGHAAEEASESAAMNTPMEEIGEYSQFPIRSPKIKVGEYSMDVPTGRNQHRAEFRMKDDMSGDAPVPTDYGHGMRGQMPTAGDAGSFKVKGDIGNSVPLGSDYGDAMGPFPSGRRIRTDRTSGQDSIERSARTARNRNRGIFDEMDAANEAEKQDQIEAMNASRGVARKPAYHSRDSVDSAVSQSDLDNIIFRLGR